MGNLYVALLHDGMLDKQGSIVTTSLTLLDIHDICRSSRTYGVKKVFIAHSSETLRKLAGTLQKHWQQGHGATYNPDRKDALELLEIVSNFDAALSQIEAIERQPALLIATSAHPGEGRASFTGVREQLATDDRPHLIMLGTGWGMGEELLQKADLFLEPIAGPTPYNHLSVRSACAVILDRLLSIKT